MSSYPPAFHIAFRRNVYFRRLRAMPTTVSETSVITSAFALVSAAESAPVTGIRIDVSDGSAVARALLLRAEPEAVAVAATVAVGAGGSGVAVAAGCC